MTGPLPTFFIIGAQKSGTTTLHRLLQGHPEVFLCDPKEPQFFAGAGERQDPAGRGDLEWYRSLFAAAGGAAAIGEASTTYSMFPFYSDVPDRLTGIVTDPRLIYLVRDPVQRMRSSYQHGLAGGTETRPLDVALRTDPRYLMVSSYSLQLERWLAAVPRERILLLDFERLVSDPVALVQQTARFLGVSDTWQPALPGQSHNESASKRAPRAWWRTLGEGMRRAEARGGAPERLVHHERVMQAAIKVDSSARDVARRPIDPAETTVSADLDRELRYALSTDLARLAGHWGPGPSPLWLQTETF